MADAPSVHDLIWLNAEIGPGAGDVAGGSGFAATDAQFEMFKALHQKLSAAMSDYEALTTKDLPTFNLVLLKNGVTPMAPVNTNAEGAR